MTREEYIAILAKHGRRVANRVALIDVEVGKRGLDDFYACYGAELTLKVSEVCRTGLSSAFDPTGWHTYYDGIEHDLWPERMDIPADDQTDDPGVESNNDQATG